MAILRGGGAPALTLLAVSYVIIIAALQSSLPPPAPWKDTAPRMTMQTLQSAQNRVPCQMDINATTTTQAPHVDSHTFGIHPVYLDLFAKAQTLARRKLSRTLPFRAQRGVLIGPISGDIRHCIKALKNAKRIRSILPHNNRTIQISIMLSKHLKLTLDNCSAIATGAKNNNHVYYYNNSFKTADMCRMWNGGALFDDVLLIDEHLPYHVNEANAFQSSTPGSYWIQALAGYLSAPYVETLFLDSDAHPCPGFENLFAILKPFSEHLWPLPSSKIVDLAIGIDQFKGSGFPGAAYWCPGDPKALNDFQYFPERNTGAVLWNFHSSVARHLAHFAPLVAQHLYNHVATPSNRVANDQVPFQVALYLFRRLEPNFNEQTLPMHTSCRTYAGWKHAGIDGDRNGMFPRLDNGKHCRSCSCTPCLISHGTTVFVQNGKMGWEEGFTYSEPSP